MKFCKSFLLVALFLTCSLNFFGENNGLSRKVAEKSQYFLLINSGNSDNDYNILIGRYFDTISISLVNLKGDLKGQYTLFDVTAYNLGKYLVYISGSTNSGDRIDIEIMGVDQLLKCTVSLSDDTGKKIEIENIHAESIEFAKNMKDLSYGYVKYESKPEKAIKFLKAWIDCFNRINR